MSDSWGDPTSTIEEMTGLPFAANLGDGQQPGEEGEDSEALLDQAAHEPAPATPPEGDGTPDPGSQGEPSPVPEGMIRLPDGSDIALSRLEELAQIDQAFRQNPQVASAVQNAVSQSGLFVPPSVPPPVGTPEGYVAPPASDPTRQGFTVPSAPAGAPPVPEGIDRDDPTVRYLNHENQRLEQRFADLDARQQSFQQESAAQRQAVAQSAVPRARERIQQAYPHLTFDDVAKAESVAVARGLGTHFGTLYGDPERAAYEAIETAATLVPELRTKILQPAPDAAVSNIDNARRQRNLNALSGTGGTAPRTEPPPAKLNNDQKVAAMAEEIARAQTSQT